MVLTPSTPPRTVFIVLQGCIELLDRSGVEIAGARAVVIGRSNIVGVPLALLLMQRDATVTIAHSRTLDMASVCKDADIVVAAVGRPGFVQVPIIVGNRS